MSQPALAAPMPTRRRPRRWLFWLLGLCVLGYLVAPFLPEPEVTPGWAGERLKAEVVATGGGLGKSGATPGVFGYFARELYSVWFTGPQVDDEELRRLAPILGDRVVILNLNNTPVSDVGLAHLAPLSRLQMVRLYNSKFSAPQPGPRLKIRGPGLASLRRLPSLNFLELEGLDLDDAALSHLKGMNGLSTLMLSDNPIEGPGLAHLRGLKLWNLGLDGTQIDDTALPHLAGLPELRSVSLGRTNVTPAGLMALQALPKLEEVRLQGSGLLPQDLIPARRAMPGVQFKLK